jgi:hypothetical protein
VTREVKHIPFKEFASNLGRFFKQVIDDNEPVFVENDKGEGIEIRPLSTTTSKRILSDEDYRAFRSAFGGWSEIDTESLKKAIYESRHCT